MQAKDPLFEIEERLRTMSYQMNDHWALQYRKDTQSLLALVMEYNVRIKKSLEDIAQSDSQSNKITRDFARSSLNVFEINKSKIFLTENE